MFLHSATLYALIAQLKHNIFAELMMDASIWACSGLMGAFIAYYLISIFFSSLFPKSVSLLRKHICIPQIRRRLQLGSVGGKKFSMNICGTSIVTPLYLILLTVLLILNIVILALSAKSRDLLIWRSGRVLAFNFSFLIISG
jgi:hypothetical protein